MQPSRVNKMTWTMKIGNRMMRKTLLSSDFQFIGAIEAFLVRGLEKYRDGQPGLRNCMLGSSRQQVNGL